MSILDRCELTYDCCWEQLEQIMARAGTRQLDDSEHEMSVPGDGWPRFAKSLRGNDTERIKRDNVQSDASHSRVLS